MDRWIKRAVELATGLVFTGRQNPSVIPFYPQKREISGYEKPYFPRTSPERCGVSSGRMLAMLRELEKDKRVNVHSLFCLKGGKVICECSHPGYSVNVCHLSHSMTKTVTGMAIGILVDDGVLSVDERLTDLLPEYAYTDERFRDITVRHLLTMSSGVRFSEPGSVSETKWTEAFFDSSCAFIPGTEFAYNSMNSYILARIVTRLSGKSLTDFLDERLFIPLHITNRFFEKSPEGIEKGGWGLYLSCESWAKLGYMMLSGGLFEGRRVLSERWVKEALKRHSKAPESLGHFDYGYHLWTSRDGESYLFNGMLGQNVWICPKNDLVVAITSGNNELFQNSPARDIVEKYLATDLTSDLSYGFHGSTWDLKYVERHFFEGRHKIRPYTPKCGIAHRLGLKTRGTYPDEWNVLLGEYHFAKNNVGMMPLIVRAMQNNLAAGIEGIEFYRDTEGIFFVYTECGVSHRLEVGFSDFKETVIDFNGERYIVKVMGEAMEDTDRNAVYKLELLFPELPNTRILKFTFTDDGRLVMRLSEMPDERIAEVFLRELNGTNPRMSAYMRVIEKRLGKNAASKRIRDTFAPTLIGARVASSSYDAVLEEENEKHRLAARSIRWLDTLVEKLLHEDEGDEPERGFIGDIVGKIKLRIPKRENKTGEKSEMSDGENSTQK